MHGKGEFAKIKGSFCNIPIEDICSILLRPADWSGLIVVKVKRDFKYRGYVFLASAPKYLIPGTKLFKNTQ